MCLEGTKEQLAEYLLTIYLSKQTRDGSLEQDQLWSIALALQNKEFQRQHCWDCHRRNNCQASHSQ